VTIIGPSLEAFEIIPVFLTDFPNLRQRTRVLLRRAALPPLPMRVSLFSHRATWPMVTLNNAHVTVGSRAVSSYPYQAAGVSYVAANGLGKTATQL